MKKSILQLFALVCSALLLSSCFGPKTPQEVTTTFWEAVLANDVKDIVEYSTLTDSREYDSFSKDWTGFQPSWGKVVIDDNEASIVSRFASPPGSNMEDREFVTYLVRRDGAWIVDYQRTGDEVRGGIFGKLFSKLGKLGDDFSQQLEDSSEEFKSEMERMGKQLEEISESFSREASKKFENYAEQLRRDIEQLEQSINRALEDKDNNLSDEDRRLLYEASTSLEKDGARLSEPTPESIAESSENLAKLQQQLQSLDNDSVDEYKQQWRDLSEKFGEDMRAMLDEISASTETDGMGR